MAAADGLAETALLVLRERVVTYRYRPGARLSPDRLARELNIGATPMRVALALLHNDGFIEHEPRFGYRVPTPARSDLRGLYVASNLLRRRRPLRRKREQGGGQSGSGRGRWDRFGASGLAGRRCAPVRRGCYPR